MNPETIYIAKQDLATFAKSDISMLAKQYNVSKISNRDDLLWTLAIAIHLSSSRGTMDGNESPPNFYEIMDAILEKDIHLLRSFNLSRKDIAYIGKNKEVLRELMFVIDDPKGVAIAVYCIIY
jgi:hypothetical protein